MKRIATDRTRALAMFAALAALGLLRGTTHGQSHETFTYASISGPNGDFISPRAHVGETVNVHVVVWNFDTYWDSIAVNSVSLVIHHRDGDVIVPNLTPDAVVVPLFRHFADIPTSFVVKPDDGDVLLVDFDVHGTDNRDGFPRGIPIGFSASGGVQIRILRPAVEISPQSDVSRADPFMISSGYVTNTGNTVLSNVVVVSDNGTPENTADDIAIEIGTLDPHTSAPYLGMFTATASPTRNTVTVRATDALGFTVNHATTRTFPATASTALRIARASLETIRVSWPASGEGFRLESSDDLGGSRNWTAVTNTPVASDSEFSVTLEISGAARFFRLAR